MIVECEEIARDGIVMELAPLEAVEPAMTTA